MKLDQKLSDLHAESEVSVSYLHSEGVASRLEVSETRLESIDGHKTANDIKYDLYKNPLTHTPQSVIDAHATYDVFHKEMEALKKQLKSNMDIELTGADIIALYIHQDETPRHKVPAPKFGPNNMVTKQTHLVTRIFTLNPTDGHQTEKHKPDGVAKVGRKLAKVEAGSEPKDYAALASIGAVEYDLIFGPEDAGKEGYLITWYISPTGEEGPPSDPLKFIII